MIGLFSIGRYILAPRYSLERSLSFVDANARTQRTERTERPERPQALPAPVQKEAVSFFGSKDAVRTLNVVRAISLLKQYGYEAWPVSFDEAVELRLMRLVVQDGKSVEVPFYKILEVRHSLSNVRHFLDEQRDPHATCYAPRIVAQEQPELTEA